MPLMEARGLAMPSWETVVGMLMKGMFWLLELVFAESIMVPPPTPKRTWGFICLIWFSVSVMSFVVIPLMKRESTLRPASLR